MDRILVSGVWFQPISSRSILESEYEHSIFRYAEDLFPGYWCIPFSELVESEFGVSRADIVLIDKEYRGWTVVEAELDHHSLSRHVEPQMRRLVNGRYTESHADAIAKKHPEVDLRRLVGLVQSTEPDFLVIVPKEDPDWRSTLSNLGVKIAAIEVYSDPQGRRVVTFSGDRPQAWDQGFVTRLIRDGVLPRAFRLETPAVLDKTDQISLLYKGFLTSWRLVTTKRATYILPNGTFDLEDKIKYCICRNGQGMLAIEVDQT